MKNTLYTLLVCFAGVCVLASCSDTPKQETADQTPTNTPVKTIDWQANKTKAVMTAERHYIDNGLKQGMQHAPIADGVGKYQYKHIRTLADSLMPIDQNRAVIPMRAVDIRNDSMTIDFELKYLPEKDSIVIHDTHIRAIGKTYRYSWVKEGNFWQKSVPTVQ